MNLKKKSAKSKKRYLALTTVLLLLLTVATACKTITEFEPIEESGTYKKILVNSAPELPKLPIFPKMDVFKEKDNRYTLMAVDFEKLVRFDKDFKIYSKELIVYTSQLNLILNSLQN